jgi:hypothetical protein
VASEIIQPIRDDFGSSNTPVKMQEMPQN